MTEKVSGLRHANIVEMIECGERDNRPYFISELLTGGSLDRRPAEPMDFRAAASLISTLARTMHAIHELGVIHGNLKPSKVMFAADGTPKVRGFIVSQQWRELDEGQQMTSASPAVMGTPRYMAPEQLAGHAELVGPASDVYALGLILYELLAGCLPFRAPTLWDMMEQVLRHRPQPLREVRADVPASLEKISLACLEKKPRDRYPTAAALADDLDCFLADKPLLRGPVRSRLFWKRIAGWFKGR